MHAHIKRSKIILTFAVVPCTQGVVCASVWSKFTCVCVSPCSYVCIRVSWCTSVCCTSLSILYFFLLISFSSDFQSSARSFLMPSFVSWMYFRNPPHVEEASSFALCTPLCSLCVCMYIHVNVCNYICVYTHLAVWLGVHIFVCPPALMSGIDIRHAPLCGWVQTHEHVYLCRCANAEDVRVFTFLPLELPLWPELLSVLWWDPPWIQCRALCLGQPLAFSVLISYMLMCVEVLWWNKWRPW